MKIIVDAFGGDNSPSEVLRGCRLAADEYSVGILLSGKGEEIRKAAKECGVSLDGMSIIEADSVIPVEVDPMSITKEYKNCSMAAGLSALGRGEGDAFVSAGSTGALVVGASFAVKRIKGIKRAAIATYLPTEGNGYLLVDSGANKECRPEMLVQFAVMGYVYMKKVMGIEDPRVGMVNIGTEENKGTDLQKQANELLKKAPVNFIGNVEARGLPLGDCEVAVCDGFTGNVILKGTEGLAKYFANQLKGMLKSFPGILGVPFLLGGIKKFKDHMDYTKYGGAPLLGLRKPVIKAHGSSNAEAFKNAIHQAMLCAEHRVCETTEEAVRLLPETEETEQ